MTCNECTMCPYFKIGQCNKVDYPDCSYKHISCRDNYLCDNEECEYGHGISVEKRMALSAIYSSYENKGFDDTYACRYPLQCYKQNCGYSHSINNVSVRSKVASIIRAETDDEVNRVFNEYKKVHTRHTVDNKASTGNVYKFGRATRPAFQKYINKDPPSTSPFDEEERLSQAQTKTPTSVVTNTSVSPSVSFSEMVKVSPPSPLSSPSIKPSALPEFRASAFDEIEEVDEFPSIIASNDCQGDSVKTVTPTINKVNKVDKDDKKEVVTTYSDVNVNSNGNKVILLESVYDEMQKELEELRKLKRLFNNLINEVSK